MAALLLPLLSFAQLSVTQYSTATPFLLQPNRGQVCNNNNIQDKEVLYTASDEGMELFCYKNKLRLLITQSTVNIDQSSDNPSARNKRNAAASPFRGLGGKSEIHNPQSARAAQAC